MNIPPTPALPAAIASVWNDVLFPEDRIAADAAFLEGFSPAFRVNPIKATADKVEGSLWDSGIIYAPAGLPLAYRTNRDGEYRLKVHPLTETGCIYLQSPSSQIPAHIISILASNSVSLLDLCAAPGGKTTQLAALLPHAEVVALERDKIRFQKLEFTIKRQGATNVHAFAMDALSPAKWIVERSFDVVLVDAPCSGSGTINARNPKHLEILAQDYDNYVASRAAIQIKLLEAAFSYVKVGGLVVYSTCSIDPRENEAVVTAMLQNSNRSLVPCPAQIRTALTTARPGLSQFRGQNYPAEIKDTLRITPSKEGEGFYCAVFQKKA